MGKKTKFPVFAFLGIVSIAGCSYHPRPIPKSWGVEEKASVKRRNITNYPSDSKATWVNYPPKFSGYKFYVGHSSGAKSQEEGISMATRDAYRQSIRENFGIKVRINIKSLETFKEKSYSKEFNESSRKITLMGFERRKIHIEREGDIFHVWILFRYSLQKIEKEKERIRNQKTDFIKGLSEYWAGNDDEAIKLFGSACADNIFEACSNKGLLESEKGKTKKAKRLYERACDGGIMMGCYNLGVIENKRGNTIGAKRLYQKVCDSGVIEGCYNLGNIENRKGNTSKAVRLYQKTCDNGIVEGCHNLGVIENERGNTSKAVKLYQKACDGGVMEGCHGFGIIEGKKGDMAKAERLFQKACDGRLITGCSELLNLGHIEYERGNTAKAAILYQKACDGGDTPACEILKNL